MSEPLSEVIRKCGFCLKDFTEEERPFQIIHVLEDGVTVDRTYDLICSLKKGLILICVKCILKFFHDFGKRCPRCPSFILNPDPEPFRCAYWPLRASKFLSGRCKSRITMMSSNGKHYCILHFYDGPKYEKVWEEKRQLDLERKKAKSEETFATQTTRLSLERTKTKEMQRKSAQTARLAETYAQERKEVEETIEDRVQEKFSKPIEQENNIYDEEESSTNVIALNSVNVPSESPAKNKNKDKRNRKKNNAAAKKTAESDKDAPEKSSTVANLLKDAVDIAVTSVADSSLASAAVNTVRAVITETVNVGVTAATGSALAGNIASSAIQSILPDVPPSSDASS